MDISFVIVNYQSESFLKKCLRSIRQNLADESYEIIVINNDQAALAKSPDYDLPNLQIVNNSANPGFAKSCNIGARLAEGSCLFFLNPDTEIRALNTNELLSFLNKPGIGIVAPRLTTPTGEDQPWSAGTAVGLWDILKNNLGLIQSKKIWSRNEPGQAAWVSGAALAISKKNFQFLGGFDENFFMYFEDIDLCKRTLDQGQKILRLPQFSVLHFGGQSYRDDKKQKVHYYQSQDYYFKKHFGAFSVFWLKLLRSAVLFFKK